MSVGVPHFTSPSSNGGQIVFFFFISTRADTQKKNKNWGTLALTLKNKNNFSLVFFFPECHFVTLA